MKIISILPTDLQVIVNEQAEIMRRWRSEQTYLDLINQVGSEQPLVMIKERFDLSEMAKTYAGFHRYAGLRGVESTHEISQLCWGVLLKRLKDWSYETTAEALKSDLLCRYFVGYPTYERPFSASTLWRFEQFVKEQGSECFFVELLKQIDADFPAEKSAPQVGDTFALVSRAREQSRTEMLRFGSTKVLDYLKLLQPETDTDTLSQFDLIGIFGAEKAKKEWWMSKEERVVLEERTALATQQMLSCILPSFKALPASREIYYLTFELWLKRVNKLLNDEFTFTFEAGEKGAEGKASKATLRTEHEKGTYAFGSLKDPDATFRLHNDQCDLGYNASIAASENFVREAAVATGATPDSKGVALLISKQKEQLGLVPPKLIYDRAAGTPKIFAAVTTASEGATQLVARLVDYSKNSQRFGPRDFTLGDDHGLTCPNGQVSHTRYRADAKDKSGYNYRFSPTQCQGCPLMAQCRGDKVKPTHNRAVFISDFLFDQRKALDYAKTPQFEADMIFRSTVERHIACLTLHNGARQAESYGLKNADYQLKMAATAYNLKRWATLTKEKACPEPSRREEAKKRPSNPPPD